MIYLKKFETTTQYNTAKPNLVLPNVSFIIETNGLEYNPSNPSPSHDYSQDYFTLEAIDDCTFSFDCPSGGISLSIDGGETWSEEYGVTSATVSSGAKVLCKGSMEMGGGGSSSSSSSGSGGKFFDSDGRYNIEGNIFSLYYGDDFRNITTIEIIEAFYGLFQNDTNIVSAENLSLPATTLAEGCYNNMFVGCTSLTTAPSVLPATTLANNCYIYMFNGCTSLTTAPVLSATTLADNCYRDMFRGCTSLTTAPELPATTLATECYSYMFRDCTSLNSITCLATDISADGCTSNWTYGVSSNGTFTKAASMTNWTSGVSGIPSNWTVVNAS